MVSTNKVSENSKFIPAEAHLQEKLGSRSLLRLVQRMAGYLFDRLRTAFYAGGKPLSHAKATAAIAGRGGFIQRSYLGAHAVVDYGEYLNKTYRHVEVIGSNAVKRASLDLSQKKEDKTLYAFPVVLAGGRFFADHVVTFVYDSKANAIEYYDPKGLTIKDRLWGETIHAGSENLTGIFQKIMTRYGDENTRLLQNTHKHQTDVHSCGMHVLDYIARRAANESALSIQKNGLTGEAANSARRKEFIAHLEGVHSL